MSTNPGATTQPSASTVCVAAALPSRPAGAIRPPRTATSAVNAGNPEPSTTVPPRTRRSRSGTRRTLLVAVLDLVDACRVLTDDLALARFRQVLHVLQEVAEC